MRQAGVLAAAGLYALEHNFPRLGEDNTRAAALRKGLVDLGLDCELAESNMVLFHHAEAPAIAEALGKVGVKFLAVAPTTCRLVVHQHIRDEDVGVALGCFREALEALQAIDDVDGSDLDAIGYLEGLEALEEVA
jgi:threonine aldolase